MGPPVAPPTTAADEDAAITTRLAQAVTDFQSERTGPALNTLSTLIDEAPQRDDLRITAEQWARALQGRAVQARESARRPRPLPPVMRQANQMLEVGQVFTKQQAPAVQPRLQRLRLHSKNGARFLG